MAENPYVNKVEYAGQTLMDLTGDTATPSDVLNGKTFHDRSGAPQTGSVITHDVYDGLDSTSTDDALSANQGKVLNSNITKFVDGTAMPSTFDMNDVKTAGTYYVGNPANVANWPHADGWLLFHVFVANTYVVQMVFGGRNTTNPGNRYMFTRMYYAGNWKPWIYFEGKI